MTTRTRRLAFWWLDDDLGRLVPAVIAQLSRYTPIAGRKRSATVTKVHLQTTAAWNAIIRRLATAAHQGNSPDLLIIDLGLGHDGRAQRLGSTLAAQLRVQAPEVPIVLVSAQNHESAVKSLQRLQYIQFFRIEDLDDGSRVPDLYRIAEDFPALVAMTGVSASTERRRRLHALFQVPATEANALLQCLPPALLQTWDSETAHMAARWVWQPFLQEPGFLYDELHLATALGLTPAGVRHIGLDLTPFQYTGIFARPEAPRWWIAPIRHAVRRATGQPYSVPLHHLGRQLLAAEQQAACTSQIFGHPGPAAKGDVPCVAYKDGRKTELVQASIATTQPIDSASPTPGFEIRRVMKK